MGDIDVGGACIDRTLVNAGGNTIVTDENPANATGTIDAICFYVAGTCSGVDFASFDYEGDNAFSFVANTGDENLAASDGENNYEAPGHFTAFNINAGNYIAGYGVEFVICRDTTSTPAYWYKSGDHLSADSVTFTSLSARGWSLYATGTETEEGATLEVDDADHAHTVDSPTLTQKHVLVVQDASHSHSADSPGLSQKHVLIASDADHAHASDSPSFTQKHVLVVDDSGHAHSAEVVTLTQKHALNVLDSSHAHTADNVALGGIITITGDYHIFTKDTGIRLFHKDTLRRIFEKDTDRKVFMS